MLTFRQYLLKEQEEGVHHHVTFIRGNPVHEGHRMVANQVAGAANDMGAGHTIVLSRTQDRRKNPLMPEQKLEYAKEAFPGTNVQLASPTQPTLLHIASGLHDQGVDHLHLHVGSDRVEDFQKLLNQYNGQRNPDGTPMRHGYFNFKSISVHPVGETREEGDVGVAGYSASRMREAAQNGDKAAFRSMAPATLTKARKDQMMADTYAGMNPPPEEKPAVKKPKKTK
jgi:hypothetical protein